MNRTEFTTIKKTYEQPELKVMSIELGVYGNYGDPDGHGPKPAPYFGLGNSAG